MDMVSVGGVIKVNEHFSENRSRAIIRKIRHLECLVKPIKEESKIARLI